MGIIWRGLVKAGNKNFADIAGNRAGMDLIRMAGIVKEKERVLVKVDWKSGKPCGNGFD